MQVFKRRRRHGYVPIAVAKSHGRGDPYRFEFSGFIEFDNTSEY